VTAAAVAEAVIEAGRSAIVGLRVDRRRTGKRVPAERSCGRRHPIGELGPAQRRHRVFAGARSFEDVAAVVNRVVDVTGLAGNADLVLHLVIAGLEFFQPERPIFNGRAFRNPRRTVTAPRLGHDLEVPWIEPPALRPVVQRCAADRIHHRMNGQARGIGRRRARAMGRDLAVRLLCRLRPAAKIVAQFIGREITWREPRSRFKADDFETGSRERKRGHAANRSETDDDDVRFLKVDGHDRRLSSKTWRRRRLIGGSALRARPSVARPR
jgi:hypothetical protein